MSEDKKILVVDDEDDVRLFLQDFLNERNLIVDTAESGEAALIRVEKDRPDIVLLDIMMPGMDGIECLKKIKQKHPEIIVIMITALKDETRIAKAREYGAHNYIVKPFSLSYLETELMKLFES